jgi:hypothetical protein
MKWRGALVPGEAMAGYRIYWFDPDNHMTGADNLIADSDEVVRRGAAEHLETASAIEIWDAARLVVRLSASSISARRA